MGKKSKVGKQRRDKYYQLAKESGFRARSAFKLIQLNRRYANFLQKSSVIVDLCAAPGGWLQVATKHVPISSLIIGVDLVPIRPIPNVITIQDDITKESCKTAIKKVLQTVLVDLVLHDGAPNVGTNWIHDAFMQAQLTLSALRLATEMMCKNARFVTKVFRSKDYPALLPVFQKLFKKVSVTKPQASRTESAEIFIICEGYKKPEKIPRSLLDPKFVFGEEKTDRTVNKLSFVVKEKQKKPKAEGYGDNDFSPYHRLKASDFINADNYIELLGQCTEVVLDTTEIQNHSATTQEVRACCEDIKVLGPRELRLVLSWRKSLRAYFASMRDAAKDDATDVAEVDEEDVADAAAIEEETKIDGEISALKEEEQREKKRSRKKDLKAKRKIRDRIELKMVIPGDQPDFPESDELFCLKNIKTRKALKKTMEAPPEMTQDDVDNEEEESKEIEDDNKEDDDVSGDSADEHDAETDEVINTSGSDPGSDEDTYFLDKDVEMTARQRLQQTNRQDLIRDRNPLIVDVIEGSEEAEQMERYEAWFKKSAFANIDEDEDMEEDILRISKDIGQKTRSTNGVESNDMEGEPVASTSGDDVFSSDQKRKADEDVADDDEASCTKKKRKKVKLDPEGLALGELMVHSSKSKRDLLEWGYNRYAFNDDNLPTWFVDDEKKHCRKKLPITKEQIDYYKDRAKDINARPIKKVAEAKARKKKKALRRMEKARKKANAVVANEGLTEPEKAHEMKRIYKATLGAINKKPETTYVVAKRGQVGRRVSRPTGVTGHFKVVDSRMKKDTRGKHKKNAGKGRSGGQKAKNYKHARKRV